MKLTWWRAWGRWAVHYTISVIIEVIRIHHFAFLYLLKKDRQKDE